MEKPIDDILFNDEEEIMLTGEIEYDDGVYVVSVQEIDVFGHGNSFDEAMNDLVEKLREYSIDYMVYADIYSKVPNRKHHLPIVERIVMCSDDEVKEMIKFLH